MRRVERVKEDGPLRSLVNGPRRTWENGRTTWTGPGWREGEAPSGEQRDGGRTGPPLSSYPGEAVPQPRTTTVRRTR